MSAANFYFLTYNEGLKDDFSHGRRRHHSRQALEGDAHALYFKKYSDTHASLFQNGRGLLKNILFDAGAAFLGSVTATTHKQTKQKKSRKTLAQT